MYCQQCGKQAMEGEKKCSVCGAALPEVSTEPTTEEQSATPSQPSTIVGQSGYQENKKAPIIPIIIGLLVVFAIAGVGFYFSLNQKGVEQNNQAIENFDSGDTDAAIAQLEDSLDSAVLDETKLKSLKNLAYMYFSRGQMDEARANFAKALELTDPTSKDYYLILAELSYIDGSGELTLANYLEAYAIAPNDYQVNNALALFYLDLDGLYPDYVNDVQALFHAQKALENDASQLELTKQNLAIAHYFNSNYSDAVYYLSTTDYETQPGMGYWMGYAYYALDDAENAAYYFQLAQDAGVEFPEDINQFLESYYLK